MFSVGPWLRRSRAYTALVGLDAARREPRVWKFFACPRRP